jgi:hypothetical protein
MRTRRPSVPGCRLIWGAPRKQRHTVRRIAARIEDEFGEAIPYPTVRDFVAARRKEIAAYRG